MVPYLYPEKVHVFSSHLRTAIMDAMKSHGCLTSCSCTPQQSISASPRNMLAVWGRVLGGSWRISWQKACFKKGKHTTTVSTGKNISNFILKARWKSVRVVCHFTSFTCMSTKNILRSCSQFLCSEQKLAEGTSLLTLQETDLTM